MIRSAVTTISSVAAISAVMMNCGQAYSDGIFVGKSEIAKVVEEVQIILNDGVVDGCMPRPKNIENSAQLALRRNNISVVEQSSTRMILDTIGFKIQNKVGYDMGCVVSINIGVFYITPIGALLLYKYSNVMTNSDEQTEDVRTSVNEAVDDFVVGLLRKREETDSAEHYDLPYPNPGASHRS